MELAPEKTAAGPRFRMPHAVLAEGFALRARFILVELRSGGLAYSGREEGWAGFAQPTALRFSRSDRSCRYESSSSNRSCAGPFCECAAGLVLGEPFWAEEHIRSR